MEKGRWRYLTKVEKTDMANRTAYSYFSGLGGIGNPKWLPNRSNRQLVFYDPAGKEYQC